MCASNAPVDVTRIRDVAATGAPGDWRALAENVAARWGRSRPLVDEALHDAAVRRWARAELITRLPGEAAGDLARSLLEWTEDFAPSRRDRTTVQFVRDLQGHLLLAHLHTLAGSNAARTMWERIAADGEQAVLAAAREVLLNADSTARETTLHLLVLDPYGDSPLGRENQDALLRLVLDDPDTEVRGLAAEVVAADLPDLILERWEYAPVDASERVRTAFWHAALAHHRDAALQYAGEIVLDPNREHAARRTALIATGESASTRQMSSLLQTLLRGDDQVLAGDAAQLMWRYHRAPDIASAASASRFEAVRELAERLLHPERGSPAAGGSRPGDPTRTGEIFDRISGSQDWRGPEPEG